MEGTCIWHAPILHQKGHQITKALWKHYCVLLSLQQRSSKLDHSITTFCISIQSPISNFRWKQPPGNPQKHIHWGFPNDFQTLAQAQMLNQYNFSSSYNTSYRGTTYHAIVLGMANCLHLINGCTSQWMCTFYNGTPWSLSLLCSPCTLLLLLCSQTIK